MNSNQFRRWLAERGATFKPGNGVHLKIFLNGRRSILPMHSGELKKSTIEGIKKQLALKDRK